MDLREWKVESEKWKGDRRRALSTFHFPLSTLVLAIVIGAGPIVASAAEPTTKWSRPQGQGVEDVKVTPQTEEIINAALKFLASKQLPNGSWASTHHQTAYTAYALMPFLATGNLPNEGPHGQTVSRGLQFLLDHVRPDGFIAADPISNMYGHGISTIVLGEIYGQTRDPQIRPKLERAIKLIVSSQSPTLGGWRYQPRPADADISVTVLQLVALRTARNGGIDVPQETLDKAIQFVRNCRDEASGGFCYVPKSKDPGFARTAAAIYSLQVCGLYEDEAVTKGAKYLRDRRQDPRNFTYGSFYAAPAMYMIGGEDWKKWYEYMHQRLITSVAKDGQLASWNDGAKPGGVGGNVWATAIYTTILALPYHYLPLYQR